jgi:hypothetical protein
VTSPALSDMFRYFARYEFRGHSALYERMSEFLADHVELAAPLRAAPPTSAGRTLPRRRAVPAAHHRGGHPLSAYFPVLGGGRPADDGAPGGAG